MRAGRTIDRLGEPNLRIGFLSLWVHDRPYMQSPSNAFDEDWVNVTLFYDNQIVSISDNGTFMTISGFERFLRETEKLYATLTGSAELSSHEPNLKIVLNSASSGHIDATFEFEPSMQIQLKCQEDLDQSYLKDIIHDVTNVIQRKDLLNA